MFKPCILFAIVLLASATSAQQKDADGWTVVAQRSTGNLNFYRNWADYKAGFSDQAEEFFIGLENLHQMTSSEPHELSIVLEDFDGQTRTANYAEFLINGEDDGYRLAVLTNYTGDAGNSLYWHRRMRFTTYDRKNDGSMAMYNCADIAMGGWWYDNCSYSNLFGLYMNGELETRNARKGMYWEMFRGIQYSLKSMKMMVRPAAAK